MREEPQFSPADATTNAMAQVTAPIIAITLVLLSVFVPIAFRRAVSPIRRDDQCRYVDIGDQCSDRLAPRDELASP